MGGNIFETIKATIVELLLPASRVEPDDLDEDGIEEVGDGWVVKCEVAVLTDPRADDIDWLVEQNLLVGESRPERSVGFLAGDQSEAILVEIGQPEQSFLKIAAE